MKTLIMGLLIMAQAATMIVVSLNRANETEKYQQEIDVRDSLINMIYSEDENFMDTYGATDQWHDYMSLKNKELMKKIEENN